MTKFGIYIKDHIKDNIVIVTTKDVESAKKIITYYNINVKSIYGNNDVRYAGSKGSLLDYILSISTYDKMIFIDDYVGHLDTVKNDNIECCFADWGYGENTNYKLFNDKK